LKKRPSIFGANTAELIAESNGDWDFHDASTQQHLHSLHPYPARFIPQIPQKAMLLWSKPGDRVLDPFCGCGTALLEASLMGRTSIGVDNNAIAVLISRAKLTHYSPRDLTVLSKFADRIVELVESFSPSVPEYHNVDYWFHTDALDDLSRLKQAITTLTKRQQLLARAVFSSIIVRTSRQDSDTRYARIVREYSAGDAFKRFRTKLCEAVTNARTINGAQKSPSEVHCLDGRKLSNIQDRQIDLIVTSPPYINAYDYHKYHRHRLHWLDADIPFARDTEIGKHDTFTRPKATPDQYFVDMEICFQEWYRVLRRKGRALIVIGDGIVSGKPVPVADRFTELMSNIGLALEDRWIRNLKTNSKSFNQSARIQKEHLLLFRKP